jgi:ABC-type sulfate transport system permease component
MLTLWPHAARPDSLPRLRRAGNDPQSGRSWDSNRQGERRSLLMVLPAVLVALFGLSPLLYLVPRTPDGWRFLHPSRALDVVLSTAVLAGAVVISTIAIAVPMLLLARCNWIRELAP